MELISVLAYCKRKGIKDAPIIYNRIATGKLKEGKDYKRVETKVSRIKMIWTTDKK